MEENVKPISQLLQTVGHQLINAAVNKNFNTFRSGIRHLEELLFGYIGDDWGNVRNGENLFCAQSGQ